MKTLKRILLILLALTLSASAFVACDTEGGKESNSETGTEAETQAPKLQDFDYSSANISDFVSVPKKEYESSKVTLGTEYMIKDEAVDKAIEDELFDNKAKTNGDTQVTDQAIKLGDSAFIYYTGYLNGVAFKGGSNADDTKPYELSIGSGSFIPGFEEGLIGVVPNTTSKEAPFDLHVSFPEDYSNSPDLAGKAVVFKVWIEYVVQYTIPTLTDDYVKNTLKFDGTAEEYKAHVKDTMQAEATASAESEALNAIMSLLTTKSEFKKLPEESINFWYQSYLSQIQQYVDMYKMYGMEVTLDQMACQMLGLKEGSDWQTPLTDMAKDVVKSILIYYGVANNENLTVTDAEYLAKLKELAEYYSNDQKTYTPEEIEKEIGRSTLMQNILMEKVDEYLIDHCTIEYKDE